MIWNATVTWRHAGMTPQPQPERITLAAGYHLSAEDQRKELEKPFERIDWQSKGSR
jgi:hypothetical protein